MPLRAVRGPSLPTLAMALVTLLVGCPLTAQDPPTMPAVRVQGPRPVIDGRLDDRAWESAPIAGGFVQFEPREGEAPSQPSEVRVLYDDEALYVAFRAFDASPDSIVGQLARRDQIVHSDRVHLIVDSYFDRRTAFQFVVNVAGVKADIYMYNDGAEDSGWDAVWEAATQIDTLGWTAEFRIPLSQLRFSASPRQSWGINFARHIARHNETSVWSPLSRQDQAFVSRSGVLEGLVDLAPGRRVEILPYSVARVTRAPGDPLDPFHRPTHFDQATGADLKIGVTTDLTLDLTVNPDFGQVEADPGQVNLSAFETFFPERRPFFQEGAAIFAFGLGVGDGDGANQSLFYSRRLGRPPQGSVPNGADWADVPPLTRIVAAGKLSGKTRGGWSIGAMSALTSSEHAWIDDGENQDRVLVEPRSNYSVLRLQRDFREGRSALGGISTATVRDGEAADGLGLRTRAYAAGVDARHQFRGNTLELRGVLVGSLVSGSPEAILSTQRSSARYYHRPDASHVTLDPDATSLRGWAGTAELWKVAGGPWRFALATQFRSPGFEVNDAGFLPQVDAFQPLAFVGYNQTRAGRRLRRWNVNLNGWSNWTFGGEQTDLSGNVNGSFQTLGNFNGFGGVRASAPTLSTGHLRGGPAIEMEGDVGGWFGFNTDDARPIRLNWNTNWGVRPESDSWDLSNSATLRWRPSDSGTLSLGVTYGRRVDDRQWVRRVQLDDGTRFLVGRLNQSTVAATLRADIALSPTLTLQLYAQPFLAAGSYTDFKQVTEPRAKRHRDRYESVVAAPTASGLEADLDGDGQPESFPDPDFSVRQLRSNAVLRWEYRPGSALFLVWAQRRDHHADDGRFRLGDSVDALLGEPPENVLMIKASYWWSL